MYGVVCWASLILIFVDKKNPLFYTLFQKKCNFFVVAFLWGKNVCQWIWSYIKLSTPCVRVYDSGRPGKMDRLSCVSFGKENESGQENEERHIHVINYFWAKRIFTNISKDVDLIKTWPDSGDICISRVTNVMLHLIYRPSVSGNREEHSFTECMNFRYAGLVVRVVTRTI